MSAAPGSVPRIAGARGRMPGLGPGAKPGVAGLVVIVLLALGASAAVQVQIDGRMAPYRDTPDVLWLSSGKTVKRLSLGFEGLLADIYWTRAVQFYGAQRR